MTLQLRVAFLSDALFGAGHGTAGAADVVSALEPDTGLPYLRGRTLKGLLVEACADILHVAAAADSPGLDRLEAAARSLFGVPGSDADASASMRVGTARLPAPLRDVVRDAVATRTASALTRDDVVEALTVIRRQTAIDDSGAPKVGSLRSARLALRGLTLHAPIRFDAPPSEDALSLLAACAQAVHRGGTHRTRGMGRLDLALLDETDDIGTRARKWFAKLLTDPRVRLPEVASPKRRLAPDGPAPDGPVALRYRVRLDEPLLVRGLDGDPNSAVGLDYLPGSTIRGACVGRYLSGRSVTDLAADPEGRRLFFDGALRFLNAYPVADGRRAVPTPRSWAHPKTDDGAFADFAVDPVRLVDPDTQWRRPKTPFAIPDGDATLVAPERQVAVHIQRSRRSRPSEPDDRQVFRYEALAEGQTFEGVLLCTDADAASRARPWLDGPVSFGGTASAGYGACTLSFVGTTPLDAFDEWPGTPPESAPLTITLTSPLLLRDPATGLTTTDPAAVEVAVEAAIGHPVRVVQAFTSPVLVGGFNRKWGLPLPQQRAIAAGSVFVLDDAPDALRTLEGSGLGERLTEGYGRVAVGRLRESALERRPIHDSVGKVGPIDSDSPAADLARRILDARIHRSLDRLLLATALELSTFGPLPTRSQLARLRHLLRSALGQDFDDAQRRVEAFLRDLPSTARNQLERARLGSDSLLEWLRARARGDGDLQTLIGYSADHSPSLGGLTATLEPADVRRLHLRLAFATVSLAAKRRSADA